MSDNTVRDHDGNSLNIYDNDMKYLADEYINGLHDKSQIYNTVGHCFTGLIKYINTHINFSRSILEDINILNNIWEIYVELVYKYNQKPVIEEYCLLIGISRETLYSWLRGDTRTGDICSKFGTSRSDTIKKWSEECKIGRYKSAASGNVGGIFLCKAVDGMVETAPVQLVNQEQHKSIEQIASEHNLKQLETVENRVIDDPPQADF